MEPVNLSQWEVMVLSKIFAGLTAAVAVAFALVGFPEFLLYLWEEGYTGVFTW